MSPLLAVGLSVGVVVPLLGLARLATAWLRSDACTARYGTAPYSLLVQLCPRKVAFYDRLDARWLLASSALAVALVLAALIG